jgi:glyoxylase-like metal-dependent hydrolase (beta-lactamase superfamily II)
MLRITRVLAPNADIYTLDGTNTWVIGEDPSIVIDPGPSIASHLAEVARVAGRVAAVLVTHDHPDHAPGAAELARMVGAPLHAWRLNEAERIRDRQVFHGGGFALTAIHTPGHTSDHVVFHEAQEGALFTGDAVVGRGTSFIDPPDGDLTQYLRSLRLMQELAPRTIYPGHGPVVFRAKDKLQEYVEHRAEREHQVVEALAGGSRTIEQIVEVIYAGYPAQVLPLAARSVLAHLLKLEGEGAVARSGKGESAAWSVAVPRACARCGKPVRGRARYCSTCSLIILQEGGADASAADA